MTDTSAYAFSDNRYGDPAGHATSTSADSVRAQKAHLQAQEAQQRAAEAQRLVDEQAANKAAQERSIAAAVDAGMARWQAMNYGKAQRVQIDNGQTRVENIGAMRSSELHKGVAPAALVDGLRVKVGGIEVSKAQADDMLASGDIDQATYGAAFDAALAPYGYSLRGTPRPFVEAAKVEEAEAASGDTDSDSDSDSDDDEETPDDVVKQELDAWSETVTDPAARQMAFDVYEAEGDIEAALKAVGGEEHAAQYVEAAAKVEASIQGRIVEAIDGLLSWEQLQEHFAEEDLPELRRAALRGDMKPFQQIALAGVRMRAEMSGIKL